MEPDSRNVTVDAIDEAGGGFAIDVSSVPLASGTCYAAKVVVRQLPSQIEMFCDRAINGGQGWPTPQEALAVALARGRRYVRDQVCVAAQPPAPATE